MFWSEGKANMPPALVYGGEREKSTGVNWCERYVAWSPQGSYLATFHNKGIAVWGGDRFDKIGRCAPSHCALCERVNGALRSRCGPRNAGCFVAV